MPDGTEYTVVPEALRKMVIGIDDATTKWKGAVAKLDSLKIGKNDLGLLGRAAEYPAGYEEVNELIVDKLDEGTKTLESTSETLDSVARHYEKKEADWYSEFGYIEKEM